MTQTKPRRGSQALSANCRLRVVSPPGKTGATSSLNRSRINQRSQEKRVSVRFGTRRVNRVRRSEVGSLAGRGSDADSASSESLLEDSENPWTCALVLSGLDRAVGAHTQTTATTLSCAGASRRPRRHRATQSAFPAAGLCCRPVPGALPRREHAGHRVPVPVPAVAPIRVSPQYLCLNAVTVARLVQILAHQ